MTDLSPVTRFFDLLRASGWQTCCLAVAGAALLFLSQRGYIPEITGGWLLGLYAFTFGCIALTAAAVGGFISRMTKVSWNSYSHWRAIKRARREFVEYIPYLTDDERKILSYLFLHKQKTFTAELDGGNAATLISRRIVHRALVPGQAFSQSDVPFFVPDYIFEEMEANAPVFAAKRGDDKGVHPWRVDWRTR